MKDETKIYKEEILLEDGDLSQSKLENLRNKRMALLVSMKLCSSSCFIIIPKCRFLPLTVDYREKFAAGESILEVFKEKLDLAIMV